jgi:hypothetical protein
MSTDDPTVNDLLKAGKFDEASESLWAEFNKARDAETHAINEFEKILWLTNSGAATITIGYITTASYPTFLQFLGSSMFVIGIISLLIMKFIGETNAVRDRARRQTTSEHFFLKGVPLSTFDQVRDKVFKRLAFTYKTLKSAAAIFFIVGCIMTLIGIYPSITGAITHNNQFNIYAAKCAAHVN